MKMLLVLSVPSQPSLSNKSPPDSSKARLQGRGSLQPGHTAEAQQCCIWWGFIQGKSPQIQELVALQARRCGQKTRRDWRGEKTGRQAEKMENLGRNSINELMALENVSYFLKAAGTSAESHTIFLCHISTFAFLVANEEFRAED